MSFWPCSAGLLSVSRSQKLIIGHSIISRAVLVGMERAIREMKDVMQEHWLNRKARDF